jgi:hypothetical protein
MEKWTFFFSTWLHIFRKVPRTLWDPMNNLVIIYKKWDNKIKGMHTEQLSYSHGEGEFIF